MAYTLKNTGIATNLTHCIAVDEGGTTVKDFVTSNSLSWVDYTDAATSSDIGTQAWNGTTRYYARTTSTESGNPSPTARFLKFTTAAVTFGLRANQTSASTTFIALDLIGTQTPALSYNDAIIGAASADFIGVNYNDRKWISLNSSSYIKSTNTAASGNTSLAFVSPANPTPWKLYINGAEDTTASIVESLSTTNFSASYIGRRTNQILSFVSAKYFLVAQFNTALSASDISSLNSDWFGTLFNTPSAPVITDATRKYGTQGYLTTIITL
jgi:hypothetical protein